MNHQFKLSIRTGKPTGKSSETLNFKIFFYLLPRSKPLPKPSLKMKSFIILFALVAVASAVYTTSLTGLPLNTFTNGVPYSSAGFGYTGFSQPLLSTSYGFNNLGYGGFGFGYQPVTTFGSGFASPFFSSFYKK